MKKILQIFLSGVFVLCLTVYQSSGFGENPAGEKLLRVIQDINQRYRVHFTYDREIVENIRIRENYNPDRYSNVQDALNGALERM